VGEVFVVLLVDCGGGGGGGGGLGMYVLCFQGVSNDVNVWMGSLARTYGVWWCLMGRS
jgi:hypothetical protein